MHKATDKITIKATPEQTWQVLSNLHRLPEWYVPAQRIEVLTQGPVREGWQFHLMVRTLAGIVLKALGTVKRFDPHSRLITWSGKAMGIAGDSQWQVLADGQRGSRIEHTFEGQGWLMFLSQTLGRNDMTVRKRLENLKALVEKEAEPVEGDLASNN